MSMIGNLLRVTKTELEEYLKDSSLLEKRIYEDEAESDNPSLTDIDKSWDGILFLLTGNGLESAGDHPLVKIFFSEQFIDEEQDLGYGPAHYLTPEQVATLNEHISNLKVEDLKQNYDPSRMEAVYPSIWDEGDDAFDYLSQYFIQVKQVYADATKNGEAIITFIN